MTRSKAPTPALAETARRVLAALAASRLASQVDRETLADAVALDDLLEVRVLPVSWRILADRHQAEDAALADAADADQVPGQTSILDGAE